MTEQEEDDDGRAWGCALILVCGYLTLHIAWAILG
jgi:hypothetical protein